MHQAQGLRVSPSDAANQGIHRLLRFLLASCFSTVLYREETMLQAIQQLPDWEFLAIMLVGLWGIQAVLFYAILALLWG